MVNSIGKSFDGLFNIGVDYASTIVEKKRVRLINQIVGVMALFGLMLLGINIVKGDATGFLFTLILMIPILLSSFLNFIGKPQMAKWYFAIVLIVSNTILLILYGEETGGNYTYLILISYTLIFFLKRRNILMVNGLILLCFLYSNVHLSYYEPFSDVIHIKYLTVLVSAICQVFLVFAFVQENKYFDRKTQQLLNELSLKNEALDEQTKVTEAKNKELVKVNKELESFAYATSHDLRSPLRNIVSFIDLYIHESRDKITERGHEYLGFIRRNANQMNQLVNDILKHASLNSENVEEQVALNTTLNKIKGNLLELTMGNATLSYEDNLPQIKGNRVQMEMLLQNLIENGLKYNKHDNPHVKVSSYTNPEDLIIEVEDNGIGIEEKYHDRIFQMFKRLHNQSEYEGSGIGLATCKKIVDQHNGTISVRNKKEGEGAIFEIRFPKSIILN